MNPRERLINMVVETGAFRYSPEKPFTLSSGRESPIYFDMRRLSGDPAGLTLAAAILYDMVSGTGVRAVGGLESGAIPISTAVSLTSHLRGRPIRSFYVRKSPKEHGTRLNIEGDARPPVIILDDVVTTGGSALRAARAVQEANLECLGVYCILFRGTPGDAEHIERRTGAFRYVLSQGDFSEDQTPTKTRE